jgi:hypothetical protein
VIARRIGAIVAGVLLATGAVALSTTTASADHVKWPRIGNENIHIEYDNAVRTSAPTNPTYCVYDKIYPVATARACWVANGDIWYVHDLEADGRSAIVVWEDWVCGGSGFCEVIYRQGVCRNPHGKGTWAKCNKDYSETDSHVFYFAAGTSEGPIPPHIMGMGPFVACRPQTSCSV